MPRSTSIFQPIEHQNVCPDCLYLELEELPGPPAAPGTAQIDLHATLAFNTEWQPLLDGRVKLSLTGGQLQLRIENGKLLASGALAGAVETAMGRATKGGSGQAPSWLFTTNLDAIALVGKIESVQLGRLQIVEPPCRLSAVFQLLLPDLHISDAEGLWPHGISPNKHAILERALAKILLASRFSPYISWIQWCYDCGEAPIPSLVEPAANGDNSERLLQERIQTISTAATDDFLALAELAGLDPRTDLAGGNCLAANLSDLDLSSANLSRVNLRGAVLSDTDLSEANLQEAKLSGADLSGAYLSSANLSHANLHKASLALANLSGANLQDANLKEANLSNVNLTNARVERATFGNNPGLTDELAQDLQQRGAILSR